MLKVLKGGLVDLVSRNPVVAVIGERPARGALPSRDIRRGSISIGQPASVSNAEGGDHCWSTFPPIGQGVARCFSGSLDTSAYADNCCVTTVRSKLIKIVTFLMCAWQIEILKLVEGT